MRVNEEYLEGKKRYQREMSKIKRDLPRDWVAQILRKKRINGIDRYNKTYNALINLVNGRSYKVYLTRKDLLEAVIELHDHNKSIS